MSAKLERGHAKNIANLNLLNTHIIGLDESYKPSNPKLLLDNLQAVYKNALKAQKLVNTSLAPYSIAVNNREIIFKPLSKQITKLRKAYKATQGVNKAQVEDFMTIARKLKGIRKVDNTNPLDPVSEQKKHSISQLGYDQRTNNMDGLISLLENTPNYNPNEEVYQVATLQKLKDQMLQTTQSVAKAFVPLNKARNNRNDLMYTTEDNLVDTANKTINYLLSILETQSSQYKAISKIKFIKI